MDPGSLEIILLLSKTILLKPVDADDDVGMEGRKDHGTKEAGVREKMNRNSCEANLRRRISGALRMLSYGYKS